jgi:D-galactose 1-dehydrogenase
VNPIRIAIVGAGKIARDQHVPAIRGDDRFALVATADQAGGVDGIANFADLAALLASMTEFDAVAICTPPQVRHAIAIAAIAAGKHVLLEKPPVATLSAFAHLAEAAKAAGVSLFAAWHLRHASVVEEARDWLADRHVARGRVTWREDVRRWHPGQAWLWAPGGLGVFDPGINALSLLTTILPSPLSVASARLEIPANGHTPTAALLGLRCGDAKIVADFDFLQTGPQTWSVELETTDGHRLRTRNGGAEIAIDDEEFRTRPEREYAGVYDRFATLIAAEESDADPAPLRLVADALLVAETHRVAPFIE